MSARDDVFEQELARVVRRAQRLRAALAHEADVVRVEVPACKVRAHTRGAHQRLVIKLRRKTK